MGQEHQGTGILRASSEFCLPFCLGLHQWLSGLCSLVGSSHFVGRLLSWNLIRIRSLIASLYTMSLLQASSWGSKLNIFKD